MKVMNPIADMTELEDYNTFIENSMSFRGYNLDYIGSSSVEFRLIPEKDADILPSIEVRVEEDEDAYYFVPSMVFPQKRIDGSNLNYYDSFEYYMEKYVEAAKICTMIFKEKFIPGMYSD